MADLQTSKLIDITDLLRQEQKKTTSEIVLLILWHLCWPCFVEMYSLKSIKYHKLAVNFLKDYHGPEDI